MNSQRQAVKIKYCNPSDKRWLLMTYRRLKTKKMREAVQYILNRRFPVKEQQQSVIEQEWWNFYLWSSVAVLWRHRIARMVPRTAFVTSTASAATRSTSKATTLKVEIRRQTGMTWKTSSKRKERNIRIVKCLRKVTITRQVRLWYTWSLGED